MNALGRMVAFIPEHEYVEGHGFRVGFVVEGENGYRLSGDWPYTGAVGETMPWFWGHDLTEARRLADEHNQRLGIAPEESQAIIDESIRASLAR